MKNNALICFKSLVIIMRKWQKHKKKKKEKKCMRFLQSLISINTLSLTQNIKTWRKTGTMCECVLCFCIILVCLFLQCLLFILFLFPIFLLLILSCFLLLINLGLKFVPFLLSLSLSIYIYSLFIPWDVINFKQDGCLHHDFDIF